MKIAAFVAPLGFDTLAVAVILGVRGFAPLWPALVFAVFEGAMPLVGIVLGRIAGAHFETPSAIAGGLVLFAVAAFMAKEALENEEEADRVSFNSLRAAMLAGFGISMDELAIGFPMGTSGLPVAPTLCAIAIQTLVVVFAGIIAGKQIGAALGRKTSRVAGLAAAVAFALLGAYLIAERVLLAVRPSTGSG